jgi:protein pelota
MRLKYFELRSPDGAEFSATVVSVEGIWHLYNLISVGDTIRTKTVRKVVKEGSGITGKSDTIRRTFMLAVRVTQPPVYDARGILRISGMNQTVCDDVPLQAHHTLEITYDPPQDFTLCKEEWDNLHSMRLREACSDDARADVVAVLMQNGTAQVCFINGSVFTTRAKVELAIPKKRKGTTAGRDDTIVKFFGQVADMLLTNVPADKAKVILFCGPGHIRDEFIEYMAVEASRAEASPALKSFMAERAKFCSVKVSSADRSALQEALIDPNVQQRMQSARVANDLKAYDDFQTMMARDPDRAVYGAQAVFHAVQDHAVEQLLLSDELLRATDPIERHLFTELSEDVREFGGTTQVFSSIGVAAENLKALTGVAAVLRHPMPQLDELEPDEKFSTSQLVQHYIRTRRAEKLASTETYRTKSSD